MSRGNDARGPGGGTAGGSPGDGAAFLMIETCHDARTLAAELAGMEGFAWGQAAYGQYPVVAYVQSSTPSGLAALVEAVRVHPHVRRLEARLCKHLPGDESLPPQHLAQPELAVLLVNVDYRQAKEREVVFEMRRNPRVRLARAMWGPSDIVALVQAPDPEAMRTVVFDEIKVLRGVVSTCTLPCYR